VARFLLHSFLYTRRCTKTVSAPALVTLTDWQAAYREGASPADLLGALRQRLAARANDAAVITLVSGTQLQARLATLTEVARGHADRTTLLQALPLWGVPFAV
jgi:allophanate hydrolase